MTANVPRTEARIMISVLRFMPEPGDVAAVEVEEKALVVAVDATSALPERLAVSDVEEAGRIEEIAIVFVIIDVTVDDVDDDSSFLEDLSGFIVVGDSEGGASDIEKSFMATSV